LLLRGLFALSITLIPQLMQAQAKPRQYIVVVDVSASRNQHDLEDAKRFLNSITGELKSGDEIVAVQMQQAGLTDNPKRWSLPVPDRKDNYPSARDKETVESRRRAARLVLPTFFQSAGGAAQHTDNLSTMDIVSEYVRDRGFRTTTILILSDMLQSARGIEMWHSQRMPAANFLQSQKKLGLIPGLQGSCVVVVGADASNREGKQIEHFWQSYFRLAGASLSDNDYRNTIPTSMDSVCK